MKKFTKGFHVLFLLVILCSGFLFDGCAKKNVKITRENIKVGFVYNGLITDEGYTQCQDAGRRALVKSGIPTMYVENISDGNLTAYSFIEDLIAEGCNVIYACSYGFMDSIVLASQQHPDVIFGHCSGIMQSENLSNYFGKMYQARYLSGIVAGLKTRKNRIGYVAAYKIPECIRGINAFTLGVQSVNPDAVVEVQWTNTWYDPKVEKEGADKVLAKGCDVIAQHQDTPAVQLAAQKVGAFCIGYNFIPKKVAAPKSFLTAPVFNWDVFIVDDIKRILDGTWESRSYWEGLDTGIVDLAELTELCAPGTEEKVREAKNKIINGELFIFEGELYDADGNLRVPANERMTDDEIKNMTWFVRGVNEELQ